MEKNHNKIKDFIILILVDTGHSTLTGKRLLKLKSCLIKIKMIS